MILVGRTGLESTLRRDARLELVRVATPLEAVGELSDPVEASRDLPAVVLVAAQADPGLAGDGRGNGSFLQALRRLDPAVRIVRVGGVGERGPYDDVIPADAAQAILESTLFGNGYSGNGATKRMAVADGERLLQEMLEHEPAPAAEAIGDETLALMLLHAQDPVDAAVHLIRKRSGVADAVFVPRAAELRDPEDGPERMAAGIPVEWRGRLMGWLCSPISPPDRLGPHAAWLATWLAMRDQHAQLREAAFTDPLTGAHNRRYFDYFINHAVAQAREARRSLTVLVFDIDNFKTFNDRYGHPAGDEILQETVRLLKSLIRPTDRVCRIGGDEFAVIFHDPHGPRDPASKPPASVFSIAQRFKKAICEHRFPKLGAEAPGTLTISGGLATYPWDGHGADALLHRADELAMQSKRQGKNAITLGPGAMRECMPGDGSAGA